MSQENPLRDPNFRQSRRSGLDEDVEKNIREADKAWNDSKRENEKNRIKYDNYMAAVNAMQGFSHDLSSMTESKIRWLYEFHSGRFGEEDGKQDLGDYSPAAVGRVFENVVRSDKKFIDDYLKKY